MKIILFEDSQGELVQLCDAINQVLGNKGQVVPFVANANEGTYETRVESDIIASGHQDVFLIVADCDLSKLNLYGGLSEPIVRRVADKLSIPECSYARGEQQSQEFVDNAELREGRIAVSLAKGNNEFAIHVLSIMSGFKSIYDRLPTILSNASGKKSPGTLLAKILEKPEYAEKIGLYASGDQNRVASILKLRRTNEEQRRRSLTCLLGYWLWDSVLGYPGVVVNEVAAASYLDIKGDVFQDNTIRRLFVSALYNGPFEKAKGPLWWRGMLDDLVVNSGASSGREYAERCLSRRIERSECCEDGRKPAGYYCMLSKRPVSLENSKNGLTWFPRGADLARISISKYQELEPWL